MPAHPGTPDAVCGRPLGGATPEAMPDVPPPSHSPDSGEPRGLRAWFIIYLLWLGGWTLAAVSLLHMGDGGTLAGSLAMRGWLLALMCFYLSLCNVFFPAPTAWIVLLAASPGYSLVEAGWARVLLVTILATLSTVAANLNEYHVLGYLAHFGVGQRLRRTKVYGWAIRWFDRAPFQILALVAFIPIPVDAVRWLAALRGYSRGRFALAYLVGRGPRYALFAGCSVLLQLRDWQIALVQVGLVVVALLGRLAWYLLRRSGRVQTAEQTTLGAATEEASSEF